MIDDVALKEEIRQLRLGLQAMTFQLDSLCRSIPLLLHSLQREGPATPCQTLPAASTGTAPSNSLLGSRHTSAATSDPQVTAPPASPRHAQLQGLAQTTLINEVRRLEGERDRYQGALYRLAEAVARTPSLSHSLLGMPARLR